MEEDEYRRLYLAHWPKPTPEPDPVEVKRRSLYERFAPEVAERHFRRWLAQRDATDRYFAIKHPNWPGDS